MQDAGTYVSGHSEPGWPEEGPANIQSLKHLSPEQIEEKLDENSNRLKEVSAVIREVKEGNQFLTQSFAQLERSARKENPYLAGSTDKSS